ncbi:hypothetical protein C8R47DRAFT_1065795 [Mycena vitilis]|nr:hypothetical protein C8R47DRAFT_1065795 [Mycena vitilis]
MNRQCYSMSAASYSTTRRTRGWWKRWSGIRRGSSDPLPRAGIEKRTTATMMKTRSWPAFSLAALLARPPRPPPPRRPDSIFPSISRSRSSDWVVVGCRTRCVRLIINHIRDTPFITGGNLWFHAPCRDGFSGELSNPTRCNNVMYLTPLYHAHSALCLRAVALAKASYPVPPPAVSLSLGSASYGPWVVPTFLVMTDGVVSKTKKGLIQDYWYFALD